MKALSNRLRRLEAQLVQRDYVQNPREHVRLIVSNLGGARCGLEKATCRRNPLADGTLLEVVTLNGSAVGITDDELDKFVCKFPVGMPSSVRSSYE